MYIQEYYSKIQKTDQVVACENIRFSSLFVVVDVSHETSAAAKSEEKRMFSQANQVDNITVSTATSNGEMEKVNELNFLSQIPIKSGHKTSLQNRGFEAGESNNFNLTVGNIYISFGNNAYSVGYRKHD